MGDRYKGYGQAITDKSGTRDKNEFYNVPIPLFQPS